MDDLMKLLIGDLPKLFFHINSCIVYQDINTSCFSYDITDKLWNLFKVVEIKNHRACIDSELLASFFCFFWVASNYISCDPVYTELFSRSKSEPCIAPCYKCNSIIHSICLIMVPKD